MTKSIPDTLKAFAWPVYFLGFLLIVTPMGDFLTNVMPMRPGSAEWRYGSVGLFAGFLLTPTLGVLILLFAAIVLEHRMVVKILSVLNLLVAILFLILIALFALDVVQVRASIPEDAVAEVRSRFHIGAAKAVLKYLSMVVAFGWLGWVGFRNSKLSSQRKEAIRREQESSPLLVGTVDDRHSTAASAEETNHEEKSD